MRQPGVGGTGALTDWRHMDVNSMWAVIGDHDTEAHWRQVSGWRRTSELASSHLSRLREYRAGLAQAWPPERSAAARRYLVELDQLIAMVQGTHEAAVANYTALAAATTAISCTRVALRKLHEQYSEKLWLKQTYEASLVPPPGHRGPVHVTERPPVTDAELEHLNSQARTLMYGLSTELQQAQAMLKPPPPPPPRHIRQTGNPDVYGLGPAPVIPPITPVPLPTIDAKTRPGRRTSPVQQASPSTSSGSGPALSGAENSLPSGVMDSHSPRNPSVLPPESVIGSDTRSLQPPASSYPSRPPLGTGGTGLIVPSPRTSSGSTPPAPRPTPSNGLIDTPPGIGLGPMAPGSATTAPRRPHPIGGVISGGAGVIPGGGITSRPASHREPARGQKVGIDTHGEPASTANPSGVSRRRHGEEDGSSWDPDNPWRPTQGVPPVIQPSVAYGPIDPGPAIGLNR